MIKNDNDLLMKAVSNLVKINLKNVTFFYESHKWKELQQLLTSLTPLVSILLNIEVSLINNHFTEESNTLSQTLLPFLNKQLDYSFIQTKDQFILNRFLNSLVRHVLDNDSEIQIGFILFSLSLDATKLQEIVQIQNNRIHLQSGLKYLGFSNKASELFSLHPKKLIWPEVFIYLKEKEEDIIINNLQILSKLIVQTDPGLQLRQLNNIFNQRKILVDLLLSTNNLDITIENLIVTLENLKLQDVSSIKQCFNNEPKQWIKISTYMLNQDDAQTCQVQSDQLQKLYQNFIPSQENAISIEEMALISQQLSQDYQMYKHNLYQCTISAIIASCKDNFIIAVIPTGQGKTWIQALLAKYYCNNKSKVTIVEPNELLQVQTAEKIGGIDYRMTISTPEWLYQTIPKDEIIILNEYDDIVTHNAYSIGNNSINGTWILKHKKVIAFSATSNLALEKYVNNTISQPRILKLPSQYEMIHGVSHLQLGNIISTENYQTMMEKVQNDIKKLYEIKPIIVIIEDYQLQEVTLFLKIEKLRFLIGAKESTISEIRSWEYGILILKADQVRGLDTRFARDSIVLILANVKNELQYEQYIGRGSRSLGKSEGILYTSTGERSNQIIQRLQKQNFTQYQQLEHLMKVLEIKHSSQILIDSILKGNKDGNKICSLEDLKKYTSQKFYSQLLKSLSL